MAIRLEIDIPVEDRSWAMRTVVKSSQHVLTSTAVLSAILVELVPEAWSWTELSFLMVMQAAAEVEHRATLVVILGSLCSSCTWWLNRL